MEERKRSGFWIGAARMAFGIVLLADSRAADYTVPGLGTRIENSADLRVENVRILSESTLSNGRILLEATADVRNSDVGLWEDVSANLNATISSNLYDTLSLSIEHTNLVAAGALATSSGLINVVVAAPNLDVARVEALAGRIMFATAETITGTLINQATNLPLENIQIVNEEDLSGGRVLLQISAAVRNATEEILREVSINLLNTGGTIPYTAPGGILQFGDLGANSSGAADNQIYLEVAAGDAATVRSNLLSATAYDADGLELWVFNALPRAIDPPTEAVYEAPSEAGAETKLVFTNVTDFLESLEVGELLIEDQSNPVTTFSPTAPIQYTPLENLLPFLISSVSISSNRVEVVGRKQLLATILKSATFIVTPRDVYGSSRDPYNPTLENTYTAEEKAAREVMAAAIEKEDPHDSRLADLKGLIGTPWHFNATNIIDRVKLSGEMFFRQSGLKFELKVRNFQIQRVVTGIDAGVVLNLLIEVEGKKQEDEEPKEGSKNLLPINPIPALSFNIGGVPVTIQPELTLTAGVTENVPTSLTLPLQSSFLVGIEAGFDRSRMNATNDGFFYQPFIDAHPIRVSDPTVFDDLAMTLGAWAELGLGLKIGLGDAATAQLRAGPSLAVRLNNEFTLAPFNNPWWEIDSGVDLVGRFEMDVNFLGFGEVQLADAEASLHHFNIFHRDAGGPLIRGMRAAANSPSTVEPLIGKNVRWSKMFQPRPGFGFAQGFAFGVPGSSNEVIVGGPGGVSVSDSIIAKFNANGEMLWMKDTYPLGGAIMREGAPLPDGSFFTAGTRGFEVVVSHFDREGNRNWALAYLPDPTIAVRDVEAKTNANGQAELFVTGIMNHGVVTQSDPVLLKFDAAGALVWGFYYQFPGDDEANGITITADGNVLLCGYTDADVAPVPHGTADPGNLLKNIVASGLLMKVDAANGNVLWAQAYASRWGISFADVVEAPDGTLYAGGGAGKIVTQTRPSNLFAKFSADGSLLNHVLVGDDPDWVDELPNGGNSPYDTVTSIIWTPEGLVACGNTGLGQGTSGWVMALTEELGVKFYSVFDGDYAEDLIAVADAGDGLAVLGNSRSLFPIGENTPTAFMLKLPWEGMLRFHEDTGMRSLFLQPRVYDSSGSLEFQVVSTVANSNAAPFALVNSFSSATFSNAPVTLTPGGVVVTLKTSTNHIVRALEKLDSSSVDDYASWAAYHRLASDDPEADSDGDGSPDYLESYFGQNPWNPDDPAAFTLTSTSTNNQQTVVIEFERQKFASAFPVRFESSPDLIAWTAAVGVTESVLSTSAQSDLVRLSIPVSTGALFFRAIAQTAAAP